MQTSSQVFHKNQTVIPDSVLHALDLRDGDAIVFEIDQTGVHLRKVLPVETAFPSALQGTLDEWSSAVDDEAYADL